MIDSRQKYKYFLQCDRLALSIPMEKGLRALVKRWIFPNYIWTFQKTLRKMEFYHNCRPYGIAGKFRKVFITRKFNQLSVKLGFSIPVNVFGPGLSIAHYGNIIVNHGAKIGANCRIHVGVNIGTRAGESDAAPVIGDHVYIGPGAKIYGPISLPNGTIVGANAVVNKSVQEKNCVVLGIPARCIKKADSFDLLIAATLLVDKGIQPQQVTGKSPSELKQYYLSA